MHDILRLRKLYGSHYVTVLPDGRKVPWKLLSIKDFLEYEALNKLNQYPTAYLENEIFKKCVLDPVLIQEMNNLKAGIVSSVVKNIMEYSGPDNMQNLENALEINRLGIQHIIHQIVSIICQAFPAYKPEDVYSMDYTLLLERLALAESKMLSMGILNTPLSFDNKQQKKPKKQTPRTKLREEFQKQQVPQVREDNKQEKTIITTADMAEHDKIYVGHEVSDKVLLEHKMVKDTTNIYKDYVKQVESGKTFTMPSHEERLRIAKERAKANEEKYNTMLKQQKVEQTKEMKKALEVKSNRKIRKRRS